MEKCCKRVWLVNLHGVLLLFTSYGLESATATVSANESDRLALVDFKNLITQDPLGIMTSWNDSAHFCDWIGVSCNPSKERVVALNMVSQKLAGSIPPSIGNLTYLTEINLRNNSFHGELPQEIGRLLRLQHLNMSYNSLTGKIPVNVSHCTELQTLTLDYNNLIGEMPDQLSSLSKLVYLGLGANNFTGNIPPWLGNFSSLLKISLALNNLQGGIPSELGRISGLGLFQLYGNYLSGQIPSSIYNISSIYFFSVAQNKLHGQLPPDVGFRFPGIEIFAGGANNFTGPIPVSLSNASGLQVLDFAQNSLTGDIPTNLGSLQSLVRFNFDGNNLGRGEAGDLNFLSSLANSTSLEVLGLGRNHFGGLLPSSIANLSTRLQIFTLGENLLYGSIPSGIQNLVNLISLGLEGNRFNGSVPDVIGMLWNLEGLNLNVNQFSGLIPSSFGNLTRLTRLFLEENRFEGSIPPSLGNCQNLQNLNMSSNNLNGTIPKEIIGIPSFSVALVLSHNSLTGSIPSEVGKLNNLAELDLSDNKMSGEIPYTMGNCIRLERLHLEGNSFEGAIPESLRNLRGLEELDVSLNNMSGKIPAFLIQLPSLRHLNLSYNDFEGEVSVGGIFANITSVSIIGNDKLCGGVPQLLLPACSKKRNGKLPSVKEAVGISIAVTFAISVVCSFGILCIARNSKRHSPAPPSEEWNLGLSYSELLKSTDSFADENLIGAGSFGSVYKGVLFGEGRTVAIKVLNLGQQGASKSFVHECNTLRCIRHRNLLKIITACSTVDHQGNEFKGLVFEFMVNGSLDSWLHPATDDRYQNRRLSLLQRLNIAIDVASALEYLHHHCDSPIVHCDLKPSNVLLDENMTAHVGDFGLARFLFETSKTPSRNQTLSQGLKGSIGYIPPEYGMCAQVSILGDIYSYGILLLEMFTGKRPTDFMDNLDILKFVEMALAELHVMDIVDPLMLSEEETDDYEKDDDDIEEKAITRYNDTQGNTGSTEECLVATMRIGLLCSSRSPQERMPINVVVDKLKGIREVLVRVRVLGSNSGKWI